MWFFREIVKNTGLLIAKWQAIGFVHGVMSTDNMTIIGVTIDYGPFGFMDQYNPDYTPNTYDLPGKRFTFKDQPKNAIWNL